MKFTGLEETDSDIGPGTAGEVLPVMWREPLSEQLLYSLALSSAAVEGVSLPPVEPPPYPQQNRASLDLDAWRTAWHAVWYSYASWDPAVHEAVAPSGTPLPSDLVRDATNGLDFLDEAFQKWGSQLATGTLTGVIPSEVGEATSRARTLGLRGIFVLPLQGPWYQVEHDRILLVSQGIAGDPELFAATLNSFGGPSGDR